MSDIINLLPDSLANQIAAGEVVQRPASVVKELLENSIDAQSSHIQLITKDAGKTLIQVVDNGIGMSETDARMCFERHATSKIQKTEDLFSINTLGFRGEAMASIAAVAQVELKTCQKNADLGTLIRIEGSSIKTQEDTVTAKGSSIAVKNLFFNVPARRNFLKSNSVENRHIVEEFQRVALAHPEIHFSLIQNNQEVFNLSPGKLSHRIISIFGKNYSGKIIRCTEETDMLNIHGYIGKPECAKKTRGEQYFFVNNRFIKHPYLHHAVSEAYEGLLGDDVYPFYILFMDIDAKHIDINVHPTKTEIKFDDERTIYAIMRAAVKQSLGIHNIAPSIDFDQNINFGLSNDKVKKDYDNHNSPFKNIDISSSGLEEKKTSSSPFSGFSTDKSNFSNSKKSSENIDWEKLYDGFEESPEGKEIEQLDFNEVLENAEKSANEFGEYPFTIPSNTDNDDESQHNGSGEGNIIKIESSINSNELPKQNTKDVTFQVMGSYIATQVKSGLILIDQKAAHERILYEKFISAQENPISTQQYLFHETVELTTTDYALMNALQEEIRALGFQFTIKEDNQVVIEGIPADLPQEAEQNLLETFIEQFKNNKSELKLDNKESLARSLAARSALKQGKILSQLEMHTLIDQLFACQNPNYTPNGTATYIKLDAGTIENLFITKTENQ